ncbi:P-loop containing nucleoside triphosphate hydrolase protein [Chytridium lagenaria]|nr:P-loop containing nucleoside triphosphate hydrolase protein [Chytridium lagenaria]
MNFLPIVGALIFGADPVTTVIGLGLTTAGITGGTVASVAVIFLCAVARSIDVFGVGPAGAAGAAATGADDEALKNDQDTFPMRLKDGSWTATEKIAREDHLWMDYVIVGSNQGVTFESSISQMAKNGMVDLPPLKNPEIMDLADDLAQLSHLHEPAVFWGVKNRFNKRYIYTYSGIVLIAMNPFERLDMYSVDTMREYAGKTREELEPHVVVNPISRKFAIAEESYRAMLRGNNQSIIVSGESGAGKTQSTKYIMRYFATVDSLSKMDEISILMRPETASSFEGGKSEIEQAAFGNAKTTRNDNSSRFGKFIELFFSRGPGSVRITGARIRTYLLERSRLDEPGVVKNMDDAAEFTLTQKALSTIGNVQILEKNSEASEIADTDVSLDHACRLLKLDKAEFKKWLTKRLIVTRGEKFTKDLKVDQAVIVRDSVAKFIYTRLFDWLVKIVNKNLVRDSGGNENFIGVLDIYGFEHFETNSFEQFCINYANEKLQQEFNSHVFRLEQELYMKEEIKWTMIDFNDNQPCIDLIEGKLGVLDLLDEESRLPAGNDLSFISKLHTASPPTNFSKSHVSIPPGSLRNKDTVSVEQHGVLSGSGCEFLRELVELEEDDPIALAAQQQSRALAASAGLQRKTTTGKSRKPTLGSMFRRRWCSLWRRLGRQSHM